MVDKAAAIAEKQKSRVDPMYHEKIDHLLDTYARKLAENMNQGFAIDARVPSVMIAGPANFPVGKKEKQNRARDSNMEEWQYIQGLLDKIRSTGMGGISADDPAAIEKLQKKLDGLERSQLFHYEGGQRLLPQAWQAGRLCAAVAGPDRKAESKHGVKLAKRPEAL